MLKKQLRQTEYHDQVALIQWCEMSLGKHPELAYVFAVPNGLRLPIGLAVKAKRQGLKSGVPDLFLPIPRGPYHGLFIEMKAPDGRLAPLQRTWISYLRDQKYRVDVCFSLEKAKQSLTDYLEFA